MKLYYIYQFYQVKLVTEASKKQNGAPKVNMFNVSKSKHCMWSESLN